VATKWLAKKDAETAAIFGAGIQGRTQLGAVLRVRPLKKVWVFDPNTTAAKTFSEEMTKHHGSSLDISTAETPEKALREADIICAATTSNVPVFDDAFVVPGVHINGIGSYTPEMQEVPAETVTRSKVVVDSLSAVMEEAGDLIIPIRKGQFSEDKIHGEIGQITAGHIPGRESDEEITFFKSVGLAVQDMAVAALILKKAQEQNLGTEVEL
jgi:ornithine cyclodeaminase/alanine dehydrogenase-like protein (mu-crystallin family)